MNFRPGQRRWPRVLLVIGLLLLASAAYVLYNPFGAVSRVVALLLWSHGVKHRYVLVDGYRVAYLEAKPNDAHAPDRPLLLVHGLGARADNWAGMIPELAAHGYHVYALDLLGYGDSPKPVGGDYSLSAEERLFIDFMSALHVSQADVAGWSMGGWIATKVALDRPDLVRRLLLYDSAGLYFRIDFPLSLFTPHDRASLDEMVHRIEPDRPFLRVPAVAVPGMILHFQKSKRIVNSSFGSMLSGREVLDFRVHRLRMPVLLVWGTEDHLTPFTLAERMHELVPQSVLVGMQGCGHLAAAECTKQVLPVTERFLDASPPLSPSRTVLPSMRKQ